jgi:CRP/FNR family transcriptional regulator
MVENMHTILASPGVKTKFPIWVSAEDHLPASLDEEIGAGVVRRAGAKEHIFVSGDRRTHLYRVEDGLVCLYKLAPNGQRQIVRFCFRGDLFGLGAHSEHALGAQALQPSQLRCAPMADLSRKATMCPHLAAELYQALSDELARLQDHLLIVGQRSALERVANFLVGLSRQNARTGADPASLTLPMTREDIGDFLGLTLETVSRTLTKLRVAGLAEFHQGSQITLLNIGRLEELADVK